jgi:hypothetical protein
MQNRQPATIDGGTGKVVLVPRRIAPIKLDTLRHIRDEMGRIYREARNGKMDTQDLTRLCFALDKLKDIAVAIDFETRIGALEEKESE